MSTLIFGRTSNGDHPLSKIIDDLLSGPNSARAIGLNLMHDSRVGGLREQAFLDVLRHVCLDPQNTTKDAAELLEVAMRRYRQEFLGGHAVHDPHRSANQPDRRVPQFAAEEENCLNLLNGERRQRRPRDGTLLANVLDLCGLDAVYRFAQENSAGDREWKKLFSDYPTRTGAREIADWLRRHLADGKGADERRTLFVRETLRALNRRREAEGPFQPIWATTWRKLLQRIKNGQPKTWLEASGLGREDSDRWLVVLVYPVERVRSLARPTALDAGWYDCHFPSPICLSPSLGGHPMDLQTDPRPMKLLPEFVHEQIPYEYAYWDNKDRRGPNRLLGCTAASTTDALKTQRTNHHGLLLKTYSRQSNIIIQWMPNPF